MQYYLLFASVLYQYETYERDMLLKIIIASLLLVGLLHCACAAPSRKSITTCALPVAVFNICIKIFSLHALSIAHTQVITFLVNSTIVWCIPVGMPLVPTFQVQLVELTTVGAVMQCGI